MKIEEEIKTTKFRSPLHKAALNLFFTASWLEEHHRQFFKGFGLTSQQFNILRILRGQSPKKISVSEIKDRMLDKNSDVSRLIDRLIAKKLVVKEPCPNDKRASDILITSNGQRILKKIDAKLDDLDASLLNLSPEEADHLNSLLDKFRG
jgi:DNA-binding MarR family transcriptional regulator